VPWSFRIAGGLRQAYDPVVSDVIERCTSAGRLCRTFSGGGQLVKGKKNPANNRGHYEY
jgi:hypothetical protein